MATSVTLKPNAIDISGSTSGTTTLQASAVAGTTTLTLPAATDTLVGKATTDTLTNKTLTGAAMNGTLGATTPSTASVTTLTTSSTVTHSGGTANGVAYLDGSKVLTTGSALVFDGSNLGLGVTPSAWASGWKSIDFSWGSVSGASDNINIFNNAYYNGTNFIYKNNGYATRYAQSGGINYWFNAASGTAGNAITFTQAMTLDASGNLGVGTTSPGERLHVKGADVSIKADTSSGISAYRWSFNGTNKWALYNDTSNNLIFYSDASSAERARIDSSGNLLVGTSSTLSNTAAHLQVLGVSTDDSLAVFKSGSGRTAGNILFQNASGTQVGYIQIQSAATAYVTSSDYRLKNTVTPMTGALAKVSALKPITYKWNADGSDGEGFIAHELAEVCPHAVVGEKDAVNEDGSIKPQGIDTSFLVATLTAAIKEMKAIIDTQASTITQLQADVAALKGA